MLMGASRSVALSTRQRAGQCALLLHTPHHRQQQQEREEGVPAPTWHCTERLCEITGFIKDFMQFAYKSVSSPDFKVGTGGPRFGRARGSSSAVKFGD